MSNRNCPVEAQTLDLLNKDIKTTILDMFKELQQTIAKELNENMKQCLIIQRISKKIENYKTEQIEILGFKIQLK